MVSINDVHDADDIKSPTLPVNTVCASDNLPLYQSKKFNLSSTNIVKTLITNT